jgi:hypothetical protein
MMKATNIIILMGLATLAACTQNEEIAAVDDTENIIHVGGVSTNELTLRAVQTRADETKSDEEKNKEAEPEPAEKVEWLANMLKQGMDITYLTKTAQQTAQQKAHLKLETDDKGEILKSGDITVYSLNAYDTNGKLTEVPAKWLGNGAHTFQGVYVPEGLKDKNTTKTYDDLSQYTAVPPMADISATVGRITIPLQHRLARVVAYVLIEPSMKAKLKGYKSGDDHSTENTMLRFCNVKTLDYVNADGQPVWKTERKAIPHYLKEEEVTFEGKEYGMCPRYDLIVRPTYTKRTSGSNVMYDEQAGTTDEGTNSIDFELTLDNDLEYEKHFVFDLNANDETVVYLRVSPERIDYNSAGSRLWKETNQGDNYYGVNNENGNNLSVAGSSWQRAYTNKTLEDDNVTDGHKYNADNEDEEAQYVLDSKWIEMLLQAHEGGAHHGDYFILDHDITIPASAIPNDFVFTGHLDGMGHTITIESDYLLAGLNGTYDPTPAANVHLEGNTWVPTPGWRAEVVNTTIVGGRLFKEGASITGYVNNCKDKNGQVVNHTPAIPQYK